MSFNLNVNDDFYDGSQQQQTPNPFSNSNLNFGAMPNAPPNPNNQYYNPVGFYTAPSTSPGQPGNATNYYAEWSQTQYFQPQADKNDPFSNGQQQQQQLGATDFDNEPPLLEELGINFEHIYSKTKCVLNPFAKPDTSIIHDEDLAGPLVFCIAYGFSLLLMGKIQFGYIYGITALGCLSMYCLLNLRSEQGVSAVCIGSTLGYCLLPMVILSFIGSLITLNGVVGLVISVVFILWCSISSSKLFVNALNMSNQQLLVLYPCFLLYGIFALLNAF